jgi:hypothetical protein
VSVIGLSSEFIVFSEDLNAPKITSPTHNEQFNLGTILIQWDKPQLYSGDPYDPYSLVSGSDTATYEIEYTDNYDGEKTNWYTLKRRIPWAEESYSWVVGKMVKSNSVRIRMRTKDVYTEETSVWSISETFSINVFNLVPPAIISPVSGNMYSNFILIILDETQSKNTYHQKIRYTLEYSSESQNISWTIIVSNVPPGQNVIRWNIDDLPTSNDYVLRLTAKNSSTCLEPNLPEPDQIAKRYVYGIKIQQSGVFIIDTKPPQAVIQIANNTHVTNRVNQSVNIFAEDDTTEVSSIQLRECDISGKLQLGNISSLSQFKDCPPLDYSIPFDHIVSNAPMGSISKIHWTFNGVDSENKPISSVKKLEALLIDAGGNNSLQDIVRVFLTIFDNSDDQINDFIITTEQRETLSFSGTQKSVSVSTYEVAYLGTDSGQLWILDPFPSMIYAIIDSPIVKISEFNDIILLFTYNKTNDTGNVYRHDMISPTLLYTFSNNLSKTVGTSVSGSKLYIGLENGELWEFNGSVFSLINTFVNPISCLYSDQSYLYIGFSNSSDLSLYNGSAFSTLSI